VTSYLEVLLRGTGLASQALVLGGVFVLLAIVTPLASGDGDVRRRLRTTLVLIAAGAIGVLITQALSSALEIAALADEHGWPLGAAAATPFFRAAIIRVLASVAIVVSCWRLTRRPSAPAVWIALVTLVVVLGVSGAWLSHAAGRLERRALLLVLDTVHQMAAEVWIGSLVHMTAIAFTRDDLRWPAAMLRRFSTMAVTAVATIVVAGGWLSLHYVGGLAALMGTAYGLMILTKVIVLIGLLVLGAANFRAIRRRSPTAPLSSLRLRRFVEVEVGLGITVLFVAASLTSLPPAVDLVADRASLTDVASRLAPRWPTFNTPTYAELANTGSITDRAAPRTDQDIAWSEYNHHLAGLFVLAMGILATLESVGHRHWARHWPLLFLGLAAVLFVRNDPEAWPLGPTGFWVSLTDPEVLQHRLFVGLVAVFGIFEWTVRTGRLRSPRPAFVFPLVCAVGGSLLLIHSHSVNNLKSEFLMETTHAPLGLLGMLAGWSRWLELRLPAAEGCLPGRLWGVALILVGLLLLFYRES